MAREELGRGHRPVPIPGQRVRRPEGVFQQPGGRRRGVPGDRLRESARPLQIQVPRLFNGACDVAVRRDDVAR